MLGLIIGAYGVVCYAIFFATFLYSVAFVGDLPVPYTLDGSPTAPLPQTLMTDAALLALFAVQHSVMARPAFKKAWTKIVPPAAERSTYVLASSLALIVMFLFWRPLPQVIWRAPAGPLSVGLQALSYVGWGIVLVSTFLINHFELFGLQQVYNRLTGKQAGAPQFRTPGFYKLVRHPLYVGFALAFWATPVMTVGHLIFAAGTLGYMLIAIQLEERDLVDTFGDHYRDYRKRVGMMLPKFGGGSGGA
ncbi:MAG: isoprenylcysteine carboxylmethyltransferase family protein [Proteobacteria bacterium]|nr:isoprenylcysteine carboxylmethyltransferase family protein [Pseudomonadota bacterium]